MGDKNPRKKMKTAQPRAAATPTSASPMASAPKKGLDPQPKKGGKH